MDGCAGSQGGAGRAFRNALERYGLSLRRGATTTLQVNTGLLCDLSCRHCHLDCGPDRREVMGRETMDDVVAAARRFSFSVIDVTGGAPELVPEIARFVESLAPLSPRLVVRTNLTALHDLPDGKLLEIYRRAGAVVTASLPSLDPAEVDGQRGAGVWGSSLAALSRLNEAGFGVPGSSLELDLVSNPAGALLPEEQDVVEARFRRELLRTHGIRFSRLHVFANAPLGRLRSWLEVSGNEEAYRLLLEERFNPDAVPGLMCRTLLSVDWRGDVWDCDFHLAAGIPHGAVRRNISAVEALPPEGTEIPVGDHCFACTAGAGFT